jgi:acetyl esterase/lipase
MAERAVGGRIVHEIEGMRAVKPRAMVYRRDAGTGLTMDVYVPPGTTRAPVVFFVHGGPIPTSVPKPPLWGTFISYGELAAASGLAGVTFHHRLHAPEDYPRSREDIIAAIDHVRANAQDLNVDAERVAFWVFSGGGPHISWMLRDRQPYLRCLIGFYPILDLRHMVPAASDATTLMRAERFSPAAYVRQHGAKLPILLARAGLDTAAINQSIDAFIDEALAGNALLDLHNHPQGRHGFDVLDDDARSREIISHAIAFARRHLA